MIGTIGTGHEEEPLAPIVRALPYAMFTAAFNATGQPAISLPLHWSEEGLPIGVQLVGDYGPRGPADPGGGAAGGGGAVGGAATAGVRGGVSSAAPGCPGA